MHSFTSRIQLIGVNPYVLVPAVLRRQIFRDAGKERGPVPVAGTINGFAFQQTLVKFKGRWRLYLNTPMRKATALEVGHEALFTLRYDPTPRTFPMPEPFALALRKSKLARQNFERLPPSRKKEIVRYIGFLKSAESVRRNVDRAIRFLEGKDRFVGRDKP